MTEFFSRASRSGDRMSRWRTWIAVCTLVAARAASGQPGDIPRIGVLDPSPADSFRPRLQALKEGLQRHGLEDGRHYRIEYRSADGRFERLPALAADLVKLRARVIVARNTPGVIAARDATKSIPIVMADVGDPLGLGFVKSLARPGGNITGLSNATIELLQKRMEVLREALPSLRRVAVLGNSSDQNTAHQVAEVRRAANVLRVEVRVFDLRSADELGTVLGAVAAWQPDAVLPLVHPIYRTAVVPQLPGWAAQRRLPVIYAFREDIDAGGLMAYSADSSDHYQRVAIYVAKLLAGADPAALAVERPTRFEFSINLKAARAIGLTVPQTLLARADRVIE